MESGSVKLSWISSSYSVSLVLVQVKSYFVKFRSSRELKSRYGINLISVLEELMSDAMIPAIDNL
jgi:hypothetical protein